MKAIILAAGRGTRLGRYTEELPKGMLKFQGKTLIERQIETLRKAGIDDITVATGYKAEKIDYPGIKTYHNPDYAITNMVESLFYAEAELTEDIIVSYADIIYEEALLQAMMKASGDCVVAVDGNWQIYWQARYGRVDFDLESLKLNADGSIKELGRETDSPADIEGRYVGLLKFTKKGLDTLRSIYHESREKYWDKPWQISGKTFQNAFMTDMLQEFIDRKIPIQTVITQNGWLEFDTNEDYERMLELAEAGRLESLMKIDQN